MKIPTTALLTLLTTAGCTGDKPSDDTATGGIPSGDTAGGAAETGGHDTGSGTADSTGTDSTGTDSTGTDPQPYVPDLPTAGCGAPPYEWLPTDEMGEILDYELDETLSMDAEAIRLLMELYGLDDYASAPYGVKVWRVRYRTQDRGLAVEASGLLSVPELPEAGTVPLLLYAHPTMGFTGECAPSAAGLEGAAFNILFSSQGFAVATPDYLGMNGWGEDADFLHPYAHAESTAVASLDALRAMLRFAEQEELPASPDPGTAVLWGASEGGFGALWADRYAPRYAPELGVVGVVAAVPPTDLVGLAQIASAEVSDTTWALAAAFATVNPWYGEPAPLSDVLTDREPYYFASSIPPLLSESCGDFGAVGEIAAVEDLYQADVAAALAAGEPAEPFSCYLEESTLHSPRVPLESDSPVLIVLAEEDTLVHAQPVRDDIPVLCELGYRIQHLECAGVGHVDGAVDSLPTQWAWILNRVAGVPLDEYCVINPPEECVGLDLSF